MSIFILDFKKSLWLNNELCAFKAEEEFNTFQHVKATDFQVQVWVGGFNDINVCRCAWLFLTGMGIASNITALTVTLVFSDTKPQEFIHTHRKQKWKCPFVYLVTI